MRLYELYESMGNFCRQRKIENDHVLYSVYMHTSIWKLICKIELLFILGKIGLLL